jgi:hypothetical protein
MGVSSGPPGRNTPWLQSPELKDDPGYQVNGRVTPFEIFI